MADDVRDKTGPLSPDQIQVLRGVMAGRLHAEIGASMTPRKSKGHVSQLMMSTVAKMGCRKSAEAVYRYSTHLAYLEAAELLEGEADDHRIGAEADDAVADVLNGLAQILRNRAAMLMPV